MPLFTLHRNYVLRTTKGHAVNFRKGKPTHVAPIIVADAVAIGAVPVDGAVDVLGEEEEVVVPLTAAERKAKVFDAFRIMAGRAIREDFTASGVPNAKRLPALTDFEITSKERDAYWLEFRADVQSQKDQTNLDADNKEPEAPEAAAG
jgi:hypothetical protein